MADLSPADIASLTKTNNNAFMGGMEGLVWLIAIAAMFGGGNWFGGNRDSVTSAELQASQNAQTNSLMQQNIVESIGQTKYDIAQAINMQTNTLEQQNNTNLINAIQGFNNLGLQITNQTNTLSAQLQQLGSQLSTCCCEIKTQMLQNRYEDERAKNVTLQNAIDNANQSQYLLNQLGRFVAWAGNGTQTASAG